MFKFNCFSNRLSILQLSALSALNARTSTKSDDRILKKAQNLKIPRARDTGALPLMYDCLNCLLRQNYVKLGWLTSNRENYEFTILLYRSQVRVCCGFFRPKHQHSPCKRGQTVKLPRCSVPQIRRTLTQLH